MRWAARRVERHRRAPPFDRPHRKKEQIRPPDGRGYSSSISLADPPKASTARLRTSRPPWKELGGSSRIQQEPISEDRDPPWLQWFLQAGAASSSRRSIEQAKISRRPLSHQPAGGQIAGKEQGFIAAETVIIQPVLQGIFDSPSSLSLISLSPASLAARFNRLLIRVEMDDSERGAGFFCARVNQSWAITQPAPAQ